MDIIKGRSTVENEKVVITREEYNRKLKDARLAGRVELANELRNISVNFEYELNIYGMSGLLERLLYRIRENLY